MRVLTSARSTSAQSTSSTSICPAPWLFIASPSQNARPCALPNGCLWVVYWLFIASPSQTSQNARPCARVQDASVLLCALPLSCPARMLPLAYAGPPTHLCTVACTVDNNLITIFVNLSSSIHVYHEHVRARGPASLCVLPLSYYLYSYLVYLFHPSLLLRYECCGAS